MKISVKLFAYFRDGRFKVKEMDCGVGTTVSDVIESLGIDRDEVGVTMINSKHCHLETVLSKGDTLGIFPLIGGG